MTLTLLDWRRRVHALYAVVRATADPAHAHALWRAGRDELFATHPDSPLLPEARATFAVLPVAPYDPAWRFEVEVDTAVEPAHLEVPTGTDGTVVFDRIGSVTLPERRDPAWTFGSWARWRSGWQVGRSPSGV